jgi:hypothetical protein
MANTEMSNQPQQTLASAGCKKVSIVEDVVIDYSEILAIIQERRWYTMPDFLEHCQSFYKPSFGLSSSASCSIADNQSGCSDKS